MWKRFPEWLEVLGLSRMLGMLASLCGIWTLAHLIPEFRQAPQVADTPIGRRRALLHRAGRPIQLLIMAIGWVLLVGMVIFLLPFEVMEIPRMVTTGSYYAFLVSWIALETIDWWNDQYILEPQRIIDLVKVPVIFRQQIIAPLEQVQDVRASTGFWGGILHFGNVVVETAGLTQPVVFESVWNPYAKQQVILEYIDHLADTEKQKKQQETTEQIKVWLEGYHDLMTRIVILSYTDTITVGRPIRVVWRIMGPTGLAYRTQIGWNMMSHARDNAYTHWTVEFHGQGRGVHRAFIMMPHAGLVFFKVRAIFENGVEVFSTPEQLTEVQP